jgi:hypothetical protein
VGLLISHDCARTQDAESDEDENRAALTSSSGDPLKGACVVVLCVMTSCVCAVGSDSSRDGSSSGGSEKKICEVCGAVCVTNNNAHRAQSCKSRKARHRVTLKSGRLRLLCADCVKAK